MDRTAQLAISGACGTGLRFLVAFGLAGRAAIYAGIVLVTFTMGLYAVTNEPAFHRDLVWVYFVEWLSMLTEMAGAYHVTEEAQKLAANTKV
jgi:hypothetical protein